MEILYATYSDADDNRSAPRRRAPRARMRPTHNNETRNSTDAFAFARVSAVLIFAGGGRRAVIQRAHARLITTWQAKDPHRQLGGRGTPGCAGGNGRHPRSTGRQLHAVHSVTVEGIQFTPSGGTLETFRFTDKNGTQWSVPTNIGRLSNVDRQRPNSFIRVGKRYFVHAQVCGSGGNASLISMYDAAVISARSLNTSHRPGGFARKALSRHNDTYRFRWNLGLRTTRMP